MVSFFEMLIGVAAQMQLNLEDPDDLEAFLDFVLETNDDDMAMQIVEVLHNYVDFRHRNDMFGEDWNDVAHATEQALRDFDPVPAELYEAIEASYDLPDGQRRAAYFNLNIVRAVDGLLEWIGKAHEITSSGMPKRADIETVAALIGVNAKGVAKLPPFDDRMHQTHARLFDDSATSDSPDSQEPQLVRSATELPMLACWWPALTSAELTERRGTRIRPGARAALWQGTATTHSGDLAEHNLETAERLATIFVAEVLTHRLANDRYGFGHRVSIGAIAMLMAAVLGEAPDPDAIAAQRSVFGGGADLLISLLVDAGLAKRSSGSIIVAPEFRSAVGNGINFAMEFIAGGVETTD